MIQSYTDHYTTKVLAAMQEAGFTCVDKYYPVKAKRELPLHKSYESVTKTKVLLPGTVVFLSTEPTVDFCGDIVTLSLKLWIPSANGFQAEDTYSFEIANTETKHLVVDISPLTSSFVPVQDFSDGTLTTYCQIARKCFKKIQHAKLLCWGVLTLPGVYVVTMLAATVAALLFSGSINNTLLNCDCIACGILAVCITCLVLFYFYTKRQREHVGLSELYASLLKLEN